MRRLLLPVALLLSFSACHLFSPPPALAPADVIKWRADLTIVALDIAQDAVIALNKVQICATNTPCHSLIPNDDMKFGIDVLTAAAQTIGKIREGFYATALAAVTNLENHFGPASAFYVYLETARAAIEVASRKVM